MKPLKIVIADDESVIRMDLKEILQEAGHEVVGETANGRRAVAIVRETSPDLVIMDVMLPGIDGVEATKRIVSHRPVPVLMLTARDEETDVIIGLSAGADDYMTKPFSMRELLARCKALLRRVERAKVIAKNSEDAKILDFGSIVIDPATRRVTLNDEAVHLTPTEFDLLTTLARKPKSVLTREQLLEEVWDWVDASGTRTVDSHVKALRHKLGSSTIRTVHGVGYAFEPPEQ